MQLTEAYISAACIVFIIIIIIHAVPTGVERLHIGGLDVTPLQQFVRLQEAAVLLLPADDQLRAGDEVMWP